MVAGHHEPSAGHQRRYRYNAGNKPMPPLAGTAGSDLVVGAEVAGAVDALVSLVDLLGDRECERGKFCAAVGCHVSAVGICNRHLDPRDRNRETFTTVADCVLCACGGKSPDMTRTVVRMSAIHGRGLFAEEDVACGEHIMEYGGRLSSWDEVLEGYDPAAADRGHTFFFDVGDGLVIDGGRDGNDARFINHSCEPNCVAERDGYVVAIRAGRDIAAGEELSLDYQLMLEDPDEAERRHYACGCGANGCRTTMLATG